MVFLASCSKRSTTHVREMRTSRSISCICFCVMYRDAYTTTFAVTQIGVLSMTFQPPSNRADHRYHRHSRHACKRARSCRKLRYPDHRAAVHALHAASSARSLNPDSCRRKRRVYCCDLCAGWHLTSKAARA